jgi:hypothetical protein
MADLSRRNQLLCSPPRPVPRELLPNDVPQLLLDRVLAPANVLAQGVIHQGLVVASPRCVHLSAKPVQNLVIDPDGNAGLTGGQGINSSPYAFAKIIVFLHSSTLELQAFPSIRYSSRNNPDTPPPQRMDDDENAT